MYRARKEFERAEPLDLAVDAFRRADADLCVNLTRRHSSPRATLLRTRAYLRLKDPAAALHELESLPYQITRLQQSEEATLRAATHNRLHEFDQLPEALFHAFMLAIANAPVEAEALYERSLYQLHMGAHREAIESARNAIAIRPDRYPHPHEHHYVMSLALTRARAFDLIGTAEAYSGNYHAQLNCVKHGIRELTESIEHDLYEEIVLLEHLTELACDVDDTIQIPAILKRAHSISWTPSTTHEHFFTSEALGWNLALHGNFAAAHDEFEGTLAFAHDPELRVSAWLDQAHLARETDHLADARDALRYAEELAAHVSWEHVGAQEQHGLLMLAEELAFSEPAHAQAALEHYRAISRATSLLPPEPKMQAWEHYVEGIIARVTELHDRACTLLMRAFSIWHEIGFTWHAALAALELCELGMREQYLAYARHEVEVRPQSWIARRARRFAEEV